MRLPWGAGDEGGFGWMKRMDEVSGPLTRLDGRRMKLKPNLFVWRRLMSRNPTMTHYHKSKLHTPPPPLPFPLSHSLSDYLHASTHAKSRPPLVYFALSLLFFKWREKTTTIFQVQCTTLVYDIISFHMRNRVTCPILGHMLGLH